MSLQEILSSTQLASPVISSKKKILCHWSGLTVGLIRASGQPSCWLHLMFSGGFQKQCHFSAAESFFSSSVLSSPALALQTCLILTVLLQQD